MSADREAPRPCRSPSLAPTPAARTPSRTPPQSPGSPLGALSTAPLPSSFPPGSFFRPLCLSVVSPSVDAGRDMPAEPRAGASASVSAAAAAARGGIGGIGGGGGGAAALAALAALGFAASEGGGAVGLSIGRSPPRVSQRSLCARVAEADVDPEGGSSLRSSADYAPSESGACFAPPFGGIEGGGAAGCGENAEDALALLSARALLCDPAFGVGSALEDEEADGSVEGAKRASALPDASVPDRPSPPGALAMQLRVGPVAGSSVGAFAAALSGEDRSRDSAATFCAGLRESALEPAALVAHRLEPSPPRSQGHGLCPSAPRFAPPAPHDLARLSSDRSSADWLRLCSLGSRRSGPAGTSDDATTLWLDAGSPAAAAIDAALETDPRMAYLGAQKRSNRTPNGGASASDAPNAADADDDAADDSPRRANPSRNALRVVGIGAPTSDLAPFPAAAAGAAPPALRRLRIAGGSTPPAGGPPPSLSDSPPRSRKLPPPDSARASPTGHLSLTLSASSQGLSSSRRDSDHGPRSTGSGGADARPPSALAGGDATSSRAASPAVDGPRLSTPSEDASRGQGRRPAPPAEGTQGGSGDVAVAAAAVAASAGRAPAGAPAGAPMHVDGLGLQRALPAIRTGSPAPTARGTDGSSRSRRLRSAGDSAPPPPSARVGGSSPSAHVHCGTASLLGSSPAPVGLAERGSAPELGRGGGATGDGLGADRTAAKLCNGLCAQQPLPAPSRDGTTALSASSPRSSALRASSLSAGAVPSVQSIPSISSVPPISSIPPISSMSSSPAGSFPGVVSACSELEEMGACLFARERSERPWRARLSSLLSSRRDVARARRVVASWMVEIAEELTLHEETICLACAIFDARLAAASGPPPRSRLQLEAVSSVLLASKREEEMHPSVSDLAELGAGCFDAADVRREELALFAALGYTLPSATTHAFLSVYRPLANLSPRTVALACYLCALAHLELPLKDRPHRTRGGSDGVGETAVGAGTGRGGTNGGEMAPVSSTPSPDDVPISPAPSPDDASTCAALSPSRVAAAAALAAAAHMGQASGATKAALCEASGQPLPSLAADALALLELQAAAAAPLRPGHPVLAVVDKFRSARWLGAAAVAPFRTPPKTLLECLVATA